MSGTNPELRPGQTLNIICQGTVSTPFGERTQETTVSVSYDELLQRFTQQTSNKLKNINIEAREFNRQCSLVNTVVKTGKWRTGADADRGQVVAKFITRFKELKETSYKDISVKAVQNLEEMVQAKALKPEQKKDLKEILDKIKATQTPETPAA